ncbi:AraC family transcriptional regulator [Vallitalea okinawensis]|uniref:AraC family transcriptional regulator n=1 Tax=Vallitalea okinawensis TaxID=2078660 RepID=UPI001478B3C5|nr:AraC family transcriptional regulator [Vallitalea okinawensis]
MNEKLLSTTNVNIRVMAYTKVKITWKEENIQPEFNRLYFICDGEGVIEVEGKKYYPKPGDIAILPAGKQQSFGTLNENTYLKYWCHFDAKVGKQNLFDLISLPYVVPVKEYSHTSDRFKTMLSYHHKEDITSLLMAKSILLELLALYFKNARSMNNYPHPVPIVKYDEQISLILYFIEKNLHTHLNNEQLAEQLHFHPNHFIRFFKNAVGISPMKYINQRRMEKAKHMLSSSFMSITEIGQKVSYSNVFHFSKAFKQYMGYSPSEYRQHYMELDHGDMHGH